MSDYLNHYNYIQHHGIKGMKWGVRRFQNKDGTRTSAGKKRQTHDKVLGVDSALKAKLRETRYSIGNRLNPREHKYAIKRTFTKENQTEKSITRMVEEQSRNTGVLTSDPKLISMIDKSGIVSHKNTVYENLNKIGRAHV